MRFLLAMLCAATLAGCNAITSSTAYVPQTIAVAPTAAAPCAPAQPAVQYRVVQTAPQAAPCATPPAAAPCANGSCAVPVASGYMVSTTRYSLNESAASAVTIPIDLVACGAGFLRCVYLRVLDPLLPPAPPSGSYALNGR